MMREWIEKNREAFERDVLRDFCLASVSLNEQFQRFEENGIVSFSVLQLLVGEPLNKGLLWRLKDKAHHIFKNSGRETPSGPLLDWTLGYIFHESLKLMEDAHQRQYYTPHEAGRPAWVNDPLLTELMSELALIQGQTRESIRREVARLQKLLYLSRKLFCRYFAGKAQHKALARFLNDSNTLVLQTFLDDYESLIKSIYGRKPERLYVQAARSLLESARIDAAKRAVDGALACNPSCPEALALREEIRGMPERVANNAGCP